MQPVATVVAGTELFINAAQESGNTNQKRY